MILGRSLRSWALAGLLALAFSASCSAPQEPDSSIADHAVEPGKIVVTYEDAPGYTDLAKSLAGSGIFEGMAESVTSVVALPADLQAVFTTCGQPNAFYTDGQVVMCYEFFDLFIEMFMQNAGDPQTLMTQVFGTGAFFYLHEIGHALVDQLQIPITAREEDSVDTLATLILLLGGSDEAIVAALNSFTAWAAAVQSQEELPFWDVHSLDAQRQYDVACMVYGSDPEKWAHIVGPGLLPIERAEGCPYEFQQKSQSWDRLLAPHYQ